MTRRRQITQSQNVTSQHIAQLFSEACGSSNSTALLYDQSS
jgi:hypothetical protein